MDVSQLFINREKVLRDVRIELAKKNFFEYCKLIDGDFFKDNRQYQKKLTEELQKFIETDDEDVLIMNIPPRHGKSYTTSRFVEWLLGRNKDYRIITGSYNEMLSTNFSKMVRNTIQEVKNDDEQVVYSDIFPGTKIKHGDGAMNRWSVEGSDVTNYLATSPKGTATGFGANIIIVDDLIKNAEEANNTNVLESHWQWFTNTLLSRLEKNSKIILVMTRWHNDDLSGRALRELKEHGYNIRHVNMKALQDDGTMLCDDILDREEYDKKTSVMGMHIAKANYQQEPIDIVGRLYKDFKTYSELPSDDNIIHIGSYTDTADKGNDYLASFMYVVTQDLYIYIIDTIFTKEPMSVTEDLLAQKLTQHKIRTAVIEANNGGHGYARNVERIMRERYNNNITIIQPFMQTKNKAARILTNATWVEERVIFPEGWRYTMPDLYDHLSTFQSEGKNKHDDGADALTGVAEVTISQFGGMKNKRTKVSRRDKINAFDSLGL